MSAPGAILYDADQIAAAVDRLASEIAPRYAGVELTAVVVLDGALIFAADLLRRLSVPTRVETVKVSSYAADAQSEVRFLAGPPQLGGRHLLIMDDILDSGRTLATLRARLANERPASLRACVLLDKPSRRQIEVPIEWRGLEVPDCFVVGYGLDFDGRYRNLPCIARLEGSGPAGPTA